MSADPGGNPNPVEDPNEANVQVPMPMAGTFRNLMVLQLAGPFPDGSVTFTVRRNAVDTPMTVTINAGSPIQVFSDTVHTAGFNAGDLFSVRHDTSSSQAALFFYVTIQYS
jgi:hypothetical protein